MFNKKRVFISGVAGLIGSNLAEYLLNQGYEVVGCDNFIGSDKENLETLKKNNNFIFEEVDITNNLNKLTTLSRGCETLFHCACLPHEGLGQFSPQAVSTSIIGGSMTIAVACARNKIKRLINLSSNARYGNVPVPYTEDITPYPC